MVEGTKGDFTARNQVEPSASHDPQIHPRPKDQLRVGIVVLWNRYHDRDTNVIASKLGLPVEMVSKEIAFLRARGGILSAWDPPRDEHTDRTRKSTRPTSPGRTRGELEDTTTEQPPKTFHAQILDAHTAGQSLEQILSELTTEQERNEAKRTLHAAGVYIEETVIGGKPTPLTQDILRNTRGRGTPISFNDLFEILSRKYQGLTREQVSDVLDDIRYRENKKGRDTSYLPYAQSKPATPAEIAARVERAGSARTRNPDMKIADLANFLDVDIEQLKDDLHRWYREHPEQRIRNPSSPKEMREKKQQILDMLAAKMSPREIQAAMKISRATYYRYLELEDLPDDETAE